MKPLLYLGRSLESSAAVAPAVNDHHDPMADGMLC